MQVYYAGKARKGLRKMPVADRRAIMAKIDTYAATGRGDVKALKGSPFFRLRHGQWRAIFEIKDGMIVVRIAHRRDVYE